MGRETIAYIAQDFVNSQTVTFVQNALGDTSDSYIANAATCVDSYRYTSSGSWSQPLHFIDANDSSPTSCSVGYDRDCNTGKCVVNAIMNFTAQLQDSKHELGGLAQCDAIRHSLCWRHPSAFA
jgi:S1/P1 Nuclease